MTDDRITSGLRNLGSDHNPPAGWERRVLAESRLRYAMVKVVDWLLIAAGVALLVMWLTGWP